MSCDFPEASYASSWGRNFSRLIKWVGVVLLIFRLSSRWKIFLDAIEKVDSIANKP